jgi:Mn2+/Fe2+ NRAMP family transporter
MFKQFIDKVPGADLFMVGSFLTFLLFFLLVGIYLVIADKDKMKQMANMPLQ